MCGKAALEDTMTSAKDCLASSVPGPKKVTGVRGSRYYTRIENKCLSRDTGSLGLCAGTKSLAVSLGMSGSIFSLNRRKGGRNYSWRDFNKNKDS